MRPWYELYKRILKCTKFGKPRHYIGNRERTIVLTGRITETLFGNRKNNFVRNSKNNIYFVFCKLKLLKESWKSEMRPLYQIDLLK